MQNSPSLNIRNQKLLRDLVIVACLALVVRTIYILLTDHTYFCCDTYRRMNLSYILFKNQTWVEDITWQPGHLWILKFLWNITENVQIMRFFFSLFDVGITIFLYLIALRLFSRKSAVFVSVVYALSSGSILLSTHAYTAVPTSFFVIVAIYFLIHYLTEPKWRYFLIYCLCLCFAESIRTEPWILSFVLGLIHIVKYKEYGWHKITIFALITIIPIFHFLFLNYQVHGKPFGWLALSDLEVSMGLRSLGFREVLKYTIYFYLSFLPLTLFSFPLSLRLFSKAHRELLIYFVPFLVWFFILMYKVFDGSLFVDPRYFYVFSIILLLLFSNAVTTWLRDNSDRWLVLVGFLIVTLSLAENAMLKKLGDWGPGFKFPAGYTQFLDKFPEISRDSLNYKIVIGRGNYNLDETFLYRMGLEPGQVVCYHSSFSQENSKEFNRYFNECFYKHDIEYIVLFPASHFLPTNRTIFRQEKGKEVLKKLEYQLIYNKGDYLVYKKQEKGIVD